MPAASFRLPELLRPYAAESAEELEQWLRRLWPILRSITGKGARLTHDLLGELLPLERTEVPSGSRCFDWVVPQEWNVDAAYVMTPSGKRILDVRENNLHLLNYSVPFRGRMSRRQLDEHLHSLPDNPKAIPYVTSYYEPRWGFCLSHEMRQSLENGEYEVVVDTRLEAGSMTMSEAVLTGETQKEVLISTYTCHPSMANNELSGPLVAAYLYRRLARVPQRRLSYRFLFLPETIGCIAYLHRHGESLRRTIEAGYVASCLGDGAPFTYKRSRRGDTLADRAATHVLSRYDANPPRVLDFSPRGSDERQYCSPGFDFPVGVIARSIYHSYPEYHTSLDNLDFVDPHALLESLDACFTVCMLIDRNATYIRTEPRCEPQLGWHGIYPTLGGRKKDETVNALMWLLNLSDGTHDLLAVADRANADFWTVHQLAERCVAAGLLHSASVASE